MVGVSGNRLVGADGRLYRLPVCASESSRPLAESFAAATSSDAGNAARIGDPFTVRGVEWIVQRASWLFVRSAARIPSALDSGYRDVAASFDGGGRTVADARDGAYA